MLRMINTDQIVGKHSHICMTILIREGHNMPLGIVMPWPPASFIKIILFAECSKNLCCLWSRCDIRSRYGVKVFLRIIWCCDYAMLVDVCEVYAFIALPFWSSEGKVRNEILNNPHAHITISDKRLPIRYELIRIEHIDKYVGSLRLSRHIKAHLLQYVGRLAQRCYSYPS
ncbi:hypothetical protein D1872_251300 [compost metagenome]